MAIAAVLKTAVRKDFWVRIPGPPFHRGSIVAIGVHLIVIAGLLLVLYALFRKGSAEVKRRM